MARSLSVWQAAVLGFLVVVGCAMGGWALFVLGHKDGYFRETFALRVAFPEVHGIDTGTQVRIRGVAAGQVVAVTFPQRDLPGQQPVVWLHLEIDEQFRSRLYADARARIHATGLMGTSVIAIDTGDPQHGAFEGDILRAEPSPGLSDVARKVDTMVSQLSDFTQEIRDHQIAGKLDQLISESQGIVHDLRTSNGTLARLIHEDAMYHDLRGAVQESRKVVGKLESSLSELRKDMRGEMGELRQFIQTGKQTLESVKQDADAVKKLPIVRSYVENPVESLMKPRFKRERRVFATDDLFAPGQATLTSTGKARLNTIVTWLRAHRIDDSEVSVAVFANPKDIRLTPESAQVLTEKQAEAVVEYLKSYKVHKLNWFFSRDVRATGFGMNRSPVVEKVKLPAAHVQILLFTPRSS